MREDGDFFKNLALTEFLDQQPDQRNTRQIYSTSSVKWSVRVSEVFHAAELEDIEQARKLFQTHILLDQIVKETYVSGRSAIVEKKDVDCKWITKLVIEMSLGLESLERKNVKAFEFLEEKGFDVTDLGKQCQHTSNSLENKMFMWYQLIKYLLGNSQHVFVNLLCKKEVIWQGPAIVGCLFTAAWRNDLALLDEVAAHYCLPGEKNWFYGPKYLNLTAHGLLLKYGLEKEGKHLQTCLVEYPNSKASSYTITDVNYSLDSPKSLEDFKQIREAIKKKINYGFLP